MKQSKNESCAELLILPDGRILVHNLTRPVAELLRELNPGCEQIVSRAKSQNAAADVTRLSLQFNK
jgi:hypothetical protein